MSHFRINVRASLLTISQYFVGIALIPTEPCKMVQSLGIETKVFPSFQNRSQHVQSAIKPSPPAASPATARGCTTAASDAPSAKCWLG